MCRSVHNVRLMTCVLNHYVKSLYAGGHVLPQSMFHAALVMLQLYPDTGVAAMLRDQWKDADFVIGSLNDRVPFREEDEIIVLAAPDPQGGGHPSPISAVRISVVLHSLNLVTSLCL
jgi:hypothetical protein